MDGLPAKEMSKTEVENNKTNHRIIQLFPKKLSDQLLYRES